MRAMERFIIRYIGIPLSVITCAALAFLGFLVHAVIGLLIALVGLLLIEALLTGHGAEKTAVGDREILRK
jgi:hypothetical protein